MKFKCDICGGIMDDLKACEEHEKECREHYGVLLYYHEEICKLVTGSHYQHITICAEIPKDDKGQEFEEFTVNGAEFKADKNKSKIVLKVKPNEKPKDEKKDKPKQGKDVKNN